MNAATGFALSAWTSFGVGILLNVAGALAKDTRYAVAGWYMLLAFVVLMIAWVDVRRYSRRHWT